jgi:protein TonB
MFDLISERVERPFRKPAMVPRILSTTLHVVIIAVVIAIPLLTVTNTLPDAPSMMAFVADSPAPPPPPPPPAPPAAAKPARPEPAKPASVVAAPVEAPSEIPPAPATANANASTSSSAGVAGGAENGVEGGVSQGISGGIVGGVVEAPPPPPSTPAGPVRVGGRITAPALLHRVDPSYSAVAAGARLAGTVILEAVVDTSGCVQTVKVLRSAHAVLDREAVEALKQWRYKPLVLNGDPASFVLTVTFNFNAGH